MKIFKYSLALLILISMAVTSCKKSTFVDLNIDPTTLLKVDPGNQFLQAADHLPNDFEYYYDVYRSLNLWMQYSTGAAGNGPGFTNPSSHFNYRYGNFYSNVGPALADIPALISKMSASDQAARVYENAIASIYKAYYGFYVSDINGSIPYTQAFMARYGGTLTPVYDPQQALFDTLDLQIKTAITTLETAQTAQQVSYGTNDPFYGGAAAQWAKAGNALRLKIAMRLMKRDPAKLASISSEVLADASNQMGAIEDSWVLYVGPAFADAGGNFNPSGFLAGKPVVDFMLAKADPRLRIFYRTNSQGQYVGSPTSPDIAKQPAYQALYLATDTPFSYLQHRLFTPNYDEGDGFGPGKGDGFFPVITYAEYCFIRAELGARGITGDNASDWYTKGVTASINFYDQRATKAQISNYTPVSAGEISAYLAAPGVAFDLSKAVEQIACQAYLDFYRQPSEAWAWWKRTGYPNTTSVLAWEQLTANGTVLQLTRRASLTILPDGDPNFNNQKAAYDAMAADPNFGSGVSDAFGRVWWDQP